MTNWGDKWYSVRLTAKETIDINTIKTFIENNYQCKKYLIGQHLGDKQEKPHIHVLIDVSDDIKKHHKKFNEWLKINYYPNTKMTSMIHSKWTTDIPKTAREGTVYNTINAFTYIISGSRRNNLLFDTNILDTDYEIILNKVDKILEKQDHNIIKKTIERQYYDIIYNTIQDNIDKNFNNYLISNIYNPSINIQNIEKQHLQYLSIVILEAIDDHQTINKHFMRYNKCEEIILNGMYIYFNENKKIYPKYFQILKEKRIPKILKEIQFI